MCKYVDNKGSAVRLAIKKLGGATPGMNLGNPLHAVEEAQKIGIPLALKSGADIITSLREPVTRTSSPSANKSAHSGFETQGRNRGISDPTKKILSQSTVSGVPD